jgi:hypothetical protein
VEIDEDYILDRFNLTGLNAEVLQEYGRALDLITDQLGGFPGHVTLGPQPGRLISNPTLS